VNRFGKVSLPERLKARTLGTKASENSAEFGGKTGGRKPIKNRIQILFTR